MRLHTRKWPSILLGALAGTLAGIPAVLPATASARSSQVVGHLYVSDNTAPTNTIAAFARHADGSLTALPGSPFTAGGSGTGTGLASQGAVQVSSNGRYLLAVDAGSNEVSVLRIRHDGSLKLRRGRVIASGGDHPVSIAEHNGLVYVANAGDPNPSYAGFILGAGGGLRALPGGTVPLPSGAQPGDVLFNSAGSNLVGTRVGTSVIDSFRVGRDGRLAAAAGSPFNAQGAGPFGSEFRPTNPSQLFVSNAHDGTGNGTVSAFSVAADGTLSSIGSSPFRDFQTAPCWVEISHDGNFLFTVNTAAGSISRYAINNDGSLTLLGSTPVSSQAGVGAVDARLSLDGHTLYVNDSRIASISAFRVSGGDLNELGGSVPLPAGAAPAGLAVN